MKYIALFTLGCFITLASYSNGRYAPYQPTHSVVQAPTAEIDISEDGGGYDNAEIRKLAVIRKKAEKDLRTRHAAEVYAMVFNITPENMDSDIFGESK